MPAIKKMSTCLWFDTQAEEAARFYTGIFPNSKITQVTHYGEEGFDQHRKPAGSVLTVSFTLDGNEFTGLNGGPNFTFNEAISLELHCETQEDINYFWDKLGAGGDPRAQVCGWLKDRYGVSWQVAPAIMYEWLKDSPTPASERVMKVMMQMKKLDVAKLKAAYEGKDKKVLAGK
jgi:predicted 3-demethylubiquinone-9 3-methyltransferase (glyoxalase superfamily)